MADAPFFSIVTAIKDGLGFFKQTVPTILSQSFRDWEWIIVDDCSRDPIGDYVRSMGDPRIRYFRNESPLRQTKSLNLAIGEARGEWIVRMDGDDLADPSRLARTRDAIVENPKAKLIFSGYHVIDEANRRIATVEYRDPLNEGFYRYLDRNNPICHPSVAFKKNAPHGQSYLFDENLKNAQDYALWKRIQGDYPGSFSQVRQPLISYRLVRQSLSGAGAAEQKAELSAIRAGGSATADGVQSLGSVEQAGMQAYRIFYYRFVGAESAARAFSEQVRDIFSTAAYPPVFLKAMFYFLFRPLRAPLKTVLFKGIYR